MVCWPKLLHYTHHQRTTMQKGRTPVARQANILSFDEARRDVAAGRRSLPSLRGASSARRNDIPAFESPFRASSSEGRLRSPQRFDSGRFAGAIASPRRGSGGFVDVGDDFPASSIAPRGAHARQARARAATSASSSAAAPRHARVAECDQSHEEAPRSRFAEAKRSRAKAKAERAFAKQFGSGDASSSTVEGGSRAAVYKGEMGAKHRLAARMQNEASGKASAKRGLSFGPFALFKSRAFVASAIVAGCLVLSCSFLYPSAQQYYHALRDRDRLAAEYAALADRNESLEGNVEALQTDSGIEAYAHEQFGWVKEGEETASVRGLDLPEEGSTFRANIVSDSIEAPETWYSTLLDPLFGVE